VEHGHVLGLEAVGDADILLLLCQLLQNKPLRSEDLLVGALECGCGVN
jgi:hypothetical protein